MSVSIEVYQRPVDLAHLARYTGGDAALNAEILGLFQTQCSDLVVQLQSALDKADAKSWHDIGHSLKGAARGIGAFAFADVAAEIEALDLGANPQKARTLLSNLNEQARTVRLFIEAYLSPR